jgi:signal transduction histidine kinase
MPMSGGPDQQAIPKATRAIPATRATGMAIPVSCSPNNNCPTNEGKATDNSFIRISVIDSGSGIAPEVAKQLFQPFVTTKRDGMGVGLSISRTIVEAHGGQIWVEQNPSGGTIFHFTLPAMAEGDVDRAT